MDPGGGAVQALIEGRPLPCNHPPGPPIHLTAFQLTLVDGSIPLVVAVVAAIRRPIWSYKRSLV
jgi:hypothetical protein